MLESIMPKDYLAPLAEHFELIKIMGYGGMGICYLAKSLKDEKQYALKILHPDLQDSIEAIAQLKKEAHLEQKFQQHLNIVQTLDLMQIDNITVKVMEVMTGMTLKDYLKKSSFHRPTLQAYVHKNITKALEAVHGAGIIHCDIKPANIFIEAEGGVRLFDFGIARSIDEAVPINFSACSPTYASARVREGFIPIALDDLYSLNVVGDEIRAEGSSCSKIKVK